MNLTNCQITCKLYLIVYIIPIQLNLYVISSVHNFQFVNSSKETETWNAKWNSLEVK